MAAILSRPQCVKNLPMVHGTHKLFLDTGLPGVIGCLGGSGGGCWGWHATDVLPSTWECWSLCFYVAGFNRNMLYYVYVYISGEMCLEITHHHMKQCAHNWHLPCRQCTKTYSPVSAVHKDIYIHRVCVCVCVCMICVWHGNLKENSSTFHQQWWPRNVGCN